MTQPLKNVSIIGASGNLGAPILDALILDALKVSNHFTLQILTRDSSTATFPKNIPVHKTDFSQSSLVSAFYG
ncbi:hypothetical protein MMC28_008440 [Mycoblastus sanguinarius]|nr:hypothetical protein [Mycoblastus sanguinarius]